MAGYLSGIPTPASKAKKGGTGKGKATAVAAAKTAQERADIEEKFTIEDLPRQMAYLSALADFQQGSTKDKIAFENASFPEMLAGLQDQMAGVGQAGSGHFIKATDQANLQHQQTLKDLNNQLSQQQLTSQFHQTEKSAAEQEKIDLYGLASSAAAARAGAPAGATNTPTSPIAAQKKVITKKPAPKGSYWSQYK